MGDLSGGQILKGITQKALGLKEDGLAFYEFPEIWDKKGFKESYRRVLDTMVPATQKDVDGIVVEANYAFRLNMYMFDELQGNWFESLIKVFTGFLTSNVNNWERGK